MLSRFHLKRVQSVFQSSTCGKSKKLLPHYDHPHHLIAARNPHTVVMLRHGESLWNLENRFTGWCDVPLTQNGELDAYDAGTLMGKRELKFDVAFTSNLQRAWQTCAIALAAANQPYVETIRSSLLNERHYGALQGHFKDSKKLLKMFGEEKVTEWRRSYDVAPPSMYDLEFLQKMGPGAIVQSTSHLNPSYLDMQRLQYAKNTLNSFDDSENFNENYDTCEDESLLAPSTESLKMCEERAYGYWLDTIAPQVRAGKRVLIVAHANTIRALVKAIDQIDDDSISHLKIPNGIPLVYRLDVNLKPKEVDMGDDLGFQAKYLVSARNHQKMMNYERCVRKKLRSLFEYLDEDSDGRITRECLLRGLTQLQSYQMRPQSRKLLDMQTDIYGEGEDTSTVKLADRSKSKLATSVKVMNARYNESNVADIYEDADGYHATDYIDYGPLVKDISFDANIGNGSVYQLDPIETNKIQSDICEFEIEELIRCVPDADEAGGITLEAFLDSEKTLLPHLTKLKLLQ